MNNFIQDGTTVTTVAPTGGVVSGQAWLAGGLLLIAGTTVAEGLPLDAAVEGVFSVPKAAVAVALLADLYWDNTAKLLTTTASGNTLVGKAWKAALTNDAAVRIKLKGR